MITAWTIAKGIILAVGILSFVYLLVKMPIANWKITVCILLAVLGNILSFITLGWGWGCLGAIGCWAIAIHITDVLKLDEE